jgi:hypothetical protein
LKIKKKKIQVRRHKRRTKERPLQFTIVRSHIRNISSKGARRERFVKKRPWQSKRADLSRDDPIDEYPFNEWDEDIGYRYDLEGVDNYFKDLSLIPTQMQRKTKKEYNKIKNDFQKIVSGIILEEQKEEEKRFQHYLDKLVKEGKYKNAYEILKDLREGKISEWEITPVKEKLSKELFDKRRRYIKENAHFKSYFYKTKDKINIIQVAYTKNDEIIAYNEYYIFNKIPEQIWWSHGAIIPKHRQIGLGVSMFLSQVKTINEFFPDIEIKSVDAKPITKHSTRKLSLYKNTKLKWVD